MSEPYAALTDTGRRRQANQDEALTLPFGDGMVLLVVADGAGGMGGGDRASAETVRGLREVCLEDQSGDPASLLREGIARANSRVRAIAAAEYPLEGMASTVVTAIVRGGQAWLLNLGDTRAYLHGEGKLRQLTEDDSWVAGQVRAGQLTPEQARHSPMRSVITRAVGVEDEPELAVQELALAPGEILLLCSDGLHGPLTDDAIAAELALGATAEGLAARLIAAANSAGGPDNIGVALYVAGQ